MEIYTVETDYNEFCRARPFSDKTGDPISVSVFRGDRIREDDLHYHEKSQEYHIVTEGSVIIWVGSKNSRRVDDGVLAGIPFGRTVRYDPGDLHKVLTLCQTPSTLLAILAPSGEDKVGPDKEEFRNTYGDLIKELDEMNNILTNEDTTPNIEAVNAFITSRRIKIPTIS